MKKPERHLARCRQLIAKGPSHADALARYAQLSRHPVANPEKIVNYPYGHMGWPVDPSMMTIKVCE